LVLFIIASAYPQDDKNYYKNNSYRAFNEVKSSGYGVPDKWERLDCFLNCLQKIESKTHNYPIKYAGAIDRLPQMPKFASPAEFELLFTTAIYGEAIGGGVSAKGEYDYGPKYVADDRLMEVQRHRERYLTRKA
jgi:hypothetical protein